MNFSKENIKKALIRAIRTFAQVAASMFTIGMTAREVDWINVLSVAAVAALYSILMSVAAGLPESEVDGTVFIQDSEDLTKIVFQAEDDPGRWMNKNSIRLKVDTSGNAPQGITVDPKE